MADEASNQPSLKASADEARNTGGMAPGTGAYMAPEQVLGKDMDARTDLYGAAIVLYELVTGVTPFDTPERTELMVRRAQVEETAAPVTRRVPLAPPVLDVLMARALAKDPMHRFSSAIDMGNAFRSALGLDESKGWDAQRRFAAKARGISRGAVGAVGAVGADAGAARGETRRIGRAEAEALRTDVMVAYEAREG